MKNGIERVEQSFGIFDWKGIFVLLKMSLLVLRFFVEMCSTLLFDGAITYKHWKLVCNYSSQKNSSLVFFRWLDILFPQPLDDFLLLFGICLCFLSKKKRKERKMGYSSQLLLSLSWGLYVSWFWWVRGLYGVKIFAFWSLLCHLFFVFVWSLYALFPGSLMCSTSTIQNG